jgi:hypothetical protein
VCEAIKFLREECGKGGGREKNGERERKRNRERETEKEKERETEVQGMMSLVIGTCRGVRVRLN